MYEHVSNWLGGIYTLWWGSSYLLIWLILLMCFIGLLFFKFIWGQVRIQKIHWGRTSWVFITYVSIYLFSLLFSIAILHTTILYWNTNIEWIKTVFFMLIGVFAIILMNYAESADTQPSRFSPGSAWLQDDRLGFKEVAQKFAQTILDDQSCVSVIALEDGLWMGKSSFVRMAVEAMLALTAPNRKWAHALLYTHISLIESNEKEDFSKLFAKRWSETLNAKYPNISPECLEWASILEVILRNSWNDSMVGELMKMILRRLNEPILPTKIHKLIGSGNTNSEVASIFRNIYEIKEGRWVIVIEDMERSHLSEIHRVIEIIERFRHEWQFWLPIKLTFLLPYSREVLEDRLKSSLDGRTKNDVKVIYCDPDSAIIRDYFVTDPRFFDSQWQLPAISMENKRDFIIELLPKEWVGYKKDAVDSIIGKIREGGWYFTIPSYGKVADEANSLGYLIANFLLRESPRVISKIIRRASLFSIKVNNSPDLPLNMPLIRFCDLVGMSYLEMKFPQVVQFWKNLAFATPTAINKDLVNGVYEKKQESISPDIKTILENNDSFTESDAKELIYLLFWNTLQENDMFIASEKLDEPNSLSNRNVLQIYFQIGWVHDSRVRLKMFLDSGGNWREIDQKNAYDFGLVLSATRNEKYKKDYLDCAHRILEFMTVENSIELVDTGALEFYRLIKACYEIDQSDENIADIAKCLNTFFQNRHLPISVLLKMLSSTTGKDDGFFEEFKAMYANNWCKLVFKQIENRVRMKWWAYRNGWGKTWMWLWQIWSGNPADIESRDATNTREIAQLQSIALDITRFEDLMEWWSLLPLPDNNSGFKQLLYRNSELYSVLDHMKVVFPIEKLVILTEKQKKNRKYTELTQKVQAWKRLVTEDVDFTIWVEKPVNDIDTIARNLIESKIIEIADLPKLDTKKQSIPRTIGSN